jgi:hypothetical protein
MPEAGVHERAPTCASGETGGKVLPQADRTKAFVEKHERGLRVLARNLLVLDSPSVKFSNHRPWHTRLSNLVPIRSREMQEES